jgi:hypothetical protein
LQAKVIPHRANVRLESSIHESSPVSFLIPL